MELILKDILWVCLIVFVIALIVAVVQIILILLDLRSASKQGLKMIKDLERKVKAVTSILDVATLLVSGMEQVKHRVVTQAVSKTNWVAAVAGLKKGIKVLLGGEK